MKNNKVRKKTYNSSKTRNIVNDQNKQGRLKGISGIAEPEEFRKALKILMSEVYILPYKQEFIFSFKRYRAVLQHLSIDNGIITLLEILGEIPKKLRSFIELKEEVENNILLGNFDVAGKLLDEVYSRYGLSYWYLECKFGVLSTLGKKEEIQSIYKNSVGHIDEVVNRDFQILIEKSLDDTSTERIQFIINSIVENIDQDTIDAETIRFIFNFNPSDTYDLSKIVNYCFNLNFVDMYILLSRVFKYHRATGCDSLCNYVKELYEISGDNKLINLVNFQGDEQYNQRYFMILSDYYQEKFDKVIMNTKKLLNEIPSYAPYYDFLVKSLYQNNENLEKNTGSTLYSFINECVKILANDSLKGFDNASRIIYKYNFIDCFQYLNLAVLKTQCSFNDKKIKRLYLFLYFSSEGNSTKIDNSISRVEFIKNTQKNTSLLIPSYRKSKWQLREMYSNGEYQSVLKQYSNKYPKVIKNEMFEIYMLSIIKSQGLNEALKVLVDAYISNSARIKSDTLLAINEIFSKLEDYELLNMSDIDTIIFIHLLHKHDLQGIQLVSLYCDEYLNIHKFKGAEYIEGVGTKVKYLLEYILTVEVIKRQEVKTDIDSKIVRTKILNKLKLLNEPSANVSAEIEYLTSQYAQKKCVNKLGQGKLKVDLELMKVNIMRDFSDDFYEIMHTLNSEIKDIDDVFILGEHDRLLCYKYAHDLILKIRTLYTIDDILGVENSLNLDFRHNNIVQELRAPFEINSVICNTLNGNYLDNEFLHKHFNLVLLDKYYKLAQGHVKNFSSQVDDLLFHYLKDKHLHICTNDFEETQKLFKYEVDKSDIYSLVKYIKSNSNFTNVVDWILDFFTNKTKEALSDGKQLIKRDVCAALLQLVSDLEMKLLPIFGNDKQSSFMRELLKVQDSVYFSTLETSEWFDFSKDSADDFPIFIPIAEAQDFVKRTNSYKEITFNITNPDTSLFKGKFLKEFIRIFILVFQNAVTSCDSKCKLVVEVDNNDGYYITVRNNYDNIDMHKVEHIKKCLKDNNFIDGAGQDSGSGIFKVKKLIEFGLGSTNHIKISVDEESKEFTLSISFSTEKLTVS